VPWRNPGLLVVAGSIPRQFEDFDSEVLKDGCEEDGRTGADSVTETPFTEETMETTNRKLKSSAGRSRLWVGAFTINSSLGRGFLDTFLRRHEKE
jgi:hypothetical protein